MSDISIQQLAKLCNDEGMVLTQHLLLRLKQRDISVEDVQHAILNGEIIEQYPDDYPHPSCLLLGGDLHGNPLHAVCGISSDTLWVITTYRPDCLSWEPDLKTRKGAK